MAVSSVSTLITDLKLQPGLVQRVTTAELHFAEMMLRAVGQYSLVLVDDDNQVMYNTAMVLAAITLGWTELATSVNYASDNPSGGHSPIGGGLYSPLESEKAAGAVQALLAFCFPVGPAEGDLEGFYPDPKLAASLRGGITPVGGIIMYSGAFVDIPDTWHLCDGTGGTPDLTDKFVKGTNTEVDVGTAGGAANHTPAGTNSAPTFTGSALAGHTHDVTAAGTNSAPTFTGSALAGHTHDVTAAGTNSAPTFTGSALATHTHSVTSNVAVGNHTFTQPTISWPAGVPTASGAAVADHASHTHSVTAAGTNSAPTFTGSAVTTGTPSAVSNSSGPGSSMATAAHTHSVTAAGTVSAPTFTGSSVTSGNPSATLTHSVTQPTISWPAGVPTNASGAVDAHSVTNNPVTSGATSAGTPAGTVTAPTFTGSAVTSTSTSAGTPAGSVSAPTFTGSAVASTSTSAGTPAGTVSAPTFTGASADYQPPWYKLAFIMRVA